MAVIFVRMEQEDKKRLEAKAKELRLPVSTYCRMILLKDLDISTK